jgi:phosphonate transport system substrate-binding protein
MLLSGQLQAAWISGLAYVEYQNRLTVLAVPVFERQPSCQSYVIVNGASTARTFDDIRGTRHAFSDPDTMAGYLMTRWLLDLRHEIPASFFSHFFFTYGDRNTIRAVATGLAESGTVNGYVWEVMKGRESQVADLTPDSLPLRATRPPAHRDCEDVERASGRAGARSGVAQHRLAASRR